MKYRPEIDGLRAIAILAVLIFHAFPEALKGGFIGVDVFFVISGYLITTIIYQDLEAGTFSFKNFFSRRIKRLYPALSVVMALSIVFGYFVLFSEEYSQLGKHIASGAAFVLNFVLVGEAGYFDNEAISKPFLHLWSLGVEEQFYIIWPVVLWFAWKAKLNILSLSILLAGLSFFLNISYVKSHPVETFFWPIGRFWELLAGGILAWLTLYKKAFFSNLRTNLDSLLAHLIYSSQELKKESNTLTNLMSLTGFMLIAYGIYRVEEDFSFPGWWAVIPIVGTLLIIMAGSSARINQLVLINPIMKWFGQISYPLYLWHWPVLSFSTIIIGGELTNQQKTLAVILSILLAWLTYKFVEKPLRYQKRNSVILSLISINILLLIMGIIIWQTEGFHQRQFENGIGYDEVASLSQSNLGIGECDNDFVDTECSTKANDESVLLWGDSYARHLAGAIQASPTKIEFRQATRSACRPLLGLSVIEGKKYNEKWAKSCLSHNRDVYEFLKTNSHIKYVVLASPFDYKKLFYSQSIVVKANENLWLMALKNTIAELRSLGIKPIIVAPPPNKGGLNPFSCWKKTFRPYLHQEKSCSIGLDEFSSRTKLAYKVLRKANHFAPVLYLSDLMCNDSQCKTSIDNVPLYRDYGHLSIVGSKILGERFDISGKLISEADEYWGSQ